MILLLKLRVSLALFHAVCPCPIQFVAKHINCQHQILPCKLDVIFQLVLDSYNFLTGRDLSLVTIEMATSA